MAQVQTKPVIQPAAHKTTHPSEVVPMSKALGTSFQDTSKVPVWSHVVGEGACCGGCQGGGN